MFSFDWSINIGNVLTVVGLLAVFVTAHAANVKRLQDMETKLDLIFHWFRNNIVNRSEREDS